MTNKTPYDWDKLQKDYDAGKSLVELGPALSTIYKAVKKGLFTTRSCKESVKNRRFKPRVVSLETRKKLREHMLRRLQDGTYPTLGKNFKGRPQSYPEKWMQSVIESRFNDQNYVTEHQIGIYSLDFAWPNKRKCIEMDGATHELTVNRDNVRDKSLENLGWQTLRIKWKDCIKNKEEFILLAKKFIDEDSGIQDISLPNISTPTRICLCLHCHTEFSVGMNSRQKYCSYSCTGQSKVKLNWNDIDLESALKEIGIVKLTKQLGVSNTAIYKQLIKQRKTKIK